MDDRSLSLVFVAVAVAFLVLGVTGNGTVWFFAAVAFVAVGAAALLRQRTSRGGDDG
jgi:hypothetical protein